MDNISRAALEKAMPGLSDLVASLLPGLERHGLIESTVPYMAAVAGSIAGPRTWMLTPFGRTALKRLHEVRALLAAADD